MKQRYPFAVTECNFFFKLRKILFLMLNCKKSFAVFYFIALLLVNCFLITLMFLWNRYHQRIHKRKHHIKMEIRPLLRPDPHLVTTPILVLTPEIHPQAQIWVLMMTLLFTMQAIQLMTTNGLVTMPTSLLTTETIAIRSKGWITWKAEVSVISMEIMRAHFQPEVWKPEQWVLMTS